MLEPRRAGEPEPWAGLRESLVELCRAGRSRKIDRQMQWLKMTAVKYSLPDDVVIGIWELKGLPDLTTGEGREIVLRSIEEKEYLS